MKSGNRVLQLRSGAARFALVLVTAGALGCNTVSVQGLSAVDIDQMATSAEPSRQVEAADALAGGVGVTRNLGRAFRLYRQAADLGHVEAQFATAYMLFSGRGTEKDQSGAALYFSKAAEAGHAAAIQWMGILAEEIDKDVEQATSWYRQAHSVSAPGSHESLAKILMKQAATAERLTTLLSLAQETELEKDVKVEILQANYLPILGETDAKFLQQKLLDAGFDPKGLDGQIGPNSRRALGAFRSSRSREGTLLSIEDLKDLGFF